MEQVRIQIRFTATFAIGSPILPPPAQRMNSVQNCLHDFDFRFSQAKDLPPIRSCAVPIYSSGDSSVPTGGDVLFIGGRSCLRAVASHGLHPRRLGGHRDLATLESVPTGSQGWHGWHGSQSWQ